MVLKEQWKKNKDNWLIVILIVGFLLFMSVGGLRKAAYSSNIISDSYDSGYSNSGISAEYSKSGGYAPISEDFAPDAEDRKITKSATISTEVKRGSFKSADERLKDIISSTNSFILNENVNKYGSDNKEYYQGRYQIKIDSEKYDRLISQLKEIGEVNLFSENAKDVTGQYYNSQINLETEKARLERYDQMYKEAKEINDKLNINDRIFDQERKIKYLEESLKNIDQKIAYSDVQLTISEKKSDYVNVVMVKFSELIKNFVDSVNALLTFVFTIFPWAVFVLIIIVIWKLVKRKTG